MLHFVYNASTVCVLVSHDRAKAEFVLQVPYFPPVESLERDYATSRCTSIVLEALRDP